jgi:predicted nuclease with RNAse H fold
MYNSSIPAKGLTYQELFTKAGLRVVREIIQEQVRVIDAAILTAHNSGFNRIEHELPTNFNINNLDKADAQTLIYSELLMIYKKPEKEGGKGFKNVTIDVGVKTILHINWLNGISEEERKRRKAYIINCSH